MSLLVHFSFCMHLKWKRFTLERSFLRILNESIQPCTLRRYLHSSKRCKISNSQSVQHKTAVQVWSSLCHGNIYLFRRFIILLRRWALWWNQAEHLRNTILNLTKRLLKLFRLEAMSISKFWRRSWRLFQVGRVCFNAGTIFATVREVVIASKFELFSEQFLFRETTRRIPVYTDLFALGTSPFPDLIRPTQSLASTASKAAKATVSDKRG